MRAEQVTNPVAYHGEGPVWSERWGGLRWMDMLAGDILSLADDGKIIRRHAGKIAACVRPRSRGGAVIGVERGFALEETDETITYLDELWTGDARRAELFDAGELSDDFRVVGAAPEDWNDATFRQHAAERLEKHVAADVSAASRERLLDRTLHLEGVNYEHS